MVNLCSEALKCLSGGVSLSPPLFIHCWNLCLRMFKDIQITHKVPNTCTSDICYLVLQAQVVRKKRSDPKGKCYSLLPSTTHGSQMVSDGRSISDGLLPQPSFAAHPPSEWRVVWRSAFFLFHSLGLHGGQSGATAGSLSCWKVLIRTDCDR